MTNLRIIAILSVSFMLTLPIASANSSSTPGAVLADRPNIIFILADDLDVKLGTLNYMPNLKRLLVDQGTTIADFFVSDSLCCPARATILRGQYVHNHQVYTNGAPSGGFQKFLGIGAEDSTFATWLQAAGYQTVLLGKYLNGYPPEENRTHIPPGWSEWYSPAGGNPYSSYNYRLNENGQLIAYGDRARDYITDVLARKAADFIRRAATSQIPFFMYLAPYAPHAPANPAPRHADLFLGLQVPRVPSFNEADMSDKPARYQQRPLLTPEQVAELDAQYRQRVQSMQAVDEMILWLVLTLEATGQLQNTYIMFTSDNGYHMGHHRLLAGKATAYEEDIRVPLIVRGPGVPAGDVLRGYLAGNVDLAPTFAELAGVSAPEFVDGRSLVPLLAGHGAAAEAWRQAYLLEYYPVERRTRPRAASHDRNGVLEPPDPDEVKQAGPTPSYVGLRTARYKYVEYSTSEREFYDLNPDPYELENQAAKMDSTLQGQLSTWLRALHNCQGAGCREVEARPLCPGEP